MNAKNLLEVIGEAKDTYVLAAVNTRAEAAESPKKHLTLRRPVLIAAIIALMLLLMGCAAVILHLQDLKIAEESITRRHDAQGQHIEPTEITADVISIRGYKDSPNQLATREWYEFVQSYDTDQSIFFSTPEEDILALGDYYLAYGCYTQEMVDKVDAIAEKYSLKLLSADTVIQRWQIPVMFDALGIDSLCHDGAAAKVTDGAGYFYPEGNFKYEFEFLLPQEGNNWTYEIWASLYYTKKDYFDPDYITVDSEQYDQWTYTTSDGMEILIAMGYRSTLLFAEQEDAYLTVVLNTSGAFDVAETGTPTRQDIELAADIINFAVSPQLPDMTDMDARLAAADAEYEAKQAELAQKAAATYATYADYIKEKYLPYLDTQAGSAFARNYYALIDVTGDGQDELLLGREDDHFRDLLTIRDGEVCSILQWGHMNLCEDNIIMRTGYNEFTGWLTYSFYIPGSTEVGYIETVGYDPDMDSWYIENDTSEAPEYITEEEANAILAKYPLVEVEMLPLADFPME